MPTGTTQFGDGGGTDYNPNDPVTVYKDPVVSPSGGHTDTRQRMPLPFMDAALAFPQFSWSTGDPIPAALLEWLRGTIGPLASWFTRTNEDFPGSVGNIRDWAKNPMAAWANAGIPPALNQAIFDYGIKQMRDVYGMGGPEAWSPGGNAYSLWSSFLGLDHPTEVSGQMPAVQDGFDLGHGQFFGRDNPIVTPNPQLPPSRVDPDALLKLIGRRDFPGGTPGPVPLKPPPGLIGPGPTPPPGPYSRNSRYIGPFSRPPMTKEDLLGGRV